MKSSEAAKKLLEGRGCYNCFFFGIDKCNRDKGRSRPLPARGICARYDGSADLNPIGTIMVWPTSNALPPGWIQCDGQTVGDPGSPLNLTVVPRINPQVPGTRYIIKFK